LKHYRRALELASKHRRAWYTAVENGNVAKTLSAMGRPDEALPYYEKAIAGIESTRSYWVPITGSLTLEGNSADMSG